jgi:hypothetical protein
LPGPASTTTSKHSGLKVRSPRFAAGDAESENNFSGVSVELIDELPDALRDAPLTEKAHSEINDRCGTLRENFAKIVQRAKCVDSIVKNMLLHGS